MRLAFLGMRMRWRLLRPITLGVRVILIQDEQVLLVKHTYMPKWYLPGGAVKRGETLVDAARREAQEETGAIMQSEPELFRIYSVLFGGKSDHTATYISHDFRLEQRLDQWEIEEVGYFALTVLPADISKGTREIIADYVASQK
ncbi:NUDIX domain-containing protein [Chloroflexi bacterium TSY]|nr:NUDIX domain-containing protein [Chloroflexi bacterium TSY]